MVTEFDRLIPELAQQWNNGTGIDANSWISCIGRYDHLLGYISILWPKFVLYDGCALQGLPDPKNDEDFMRALGGDKTAVERASSPWVCRRAGAAQGSTARLRGIAGILGKRLSSLIPQAMKR